MGSFCGGRCTGLLRLLLALLNDKDRLSGNMVNTMNHISDRSIMVHMPSQ